MKMKPVPCAHIAAYYHHKWEQQPCIGYNILRQGYKQWSRGGEIPAVNNLFRSN